MQGGPLLCVTLDFWRTLPPPGLFPHLRGQQWLRSRGAVRGNENHVERPCRGASLALGTPRAVPRKEGVTQSQGPLPPHALPFSSWRQRWQHQRLRTLLQRAWGQPGPDPVQHSACLSPTGALTEHLPQVLNHGGVDPGPAAPGRSPAADAGALWAALPHRGAALSVAVD